MHYVLNTLSQLKSHRQFNFESMFTIYDIFFSLGSVSPFLLFNVPFTLCVPEPTSLRVPPVVLSFHARFTEGFFSSRIVLSIILLQLPPYREARIYVHFVFLIFCFTRRLVLYDDPHNSGQNSISSAASSSVVLLACRLPSLCQSYLPSAN
jgi:hypothetical protein